MTQSRQHLHIQDVCRVLQAEIANLRENPLHAAASMPNESPADVRHQVQASPSNRVSSTYLPSAQQLNLRLTELQTNRCMQSRHNCFSLLMQTYSKETLQLASTAPPASTPYWLTGALDD